MRKAKVSETTMNKRAQEAILGVYRTRAGYSKKTIAGVLERANAKIEQYTKDNNTAEIMKENKEVGIYMFEMDMDALNIMKDNIVGDESLKHIMLNKLFQLMVLEAKVHYDDEKSLDIANRRKMTNENSIDGIHGMYTIIKNESDIMERDLINQNLNIMYNILKNTEEAKYAEVSSVLYKAFYPNVKEEEIPEKVKALMENKDGLFFDSESVKFAEDNNLITTDEYINAFDGCRKLIDKMKESSILKTVESGTGLYKEFVDNLELKSVEEYYDENLVIMKDENNKMLNSSDYKYLKLLYQSVYANSRDAANLELLMTRKLGIQRQLKREAAISLLNGINITNNRLTTETWKLMGLEDPKADTHLTDARFLAVAIYSMIVCTKLLEDDRLLYNAIILNRGFYDDLEEYNTIIKNKIMDKVNAFFADKTDFTIKEEEKKEVTEAKDSVE